MDAHTSKADAGTVFSTRVSDEFEALYAHDKIEKAELEERRSLKAEKKQKSIQRQLALIHVDLPFLTLPRGARSQTTPTEAEPRRRTRAAVCGGGSRLDPDADKQQLRRGRSRKISELTGTTDDSQQIVIRRRRGRPRKVASPLVLTEDLPSTTSSELHFGITPSPECIWPAEIIQDTAADSTANSDVFSMPFPAPSPLPLLAPQDHDPQDMSFVRYQFQLLTLRSRLHAAVRFAQRCCPALSGGLNSLAEGCDELCDSLPVRNSPRGPDSPNDILEWTLANPVVPDTPHSEILEETARNVLRDDEKLPAFWIIYRDRASLCDVINLKKEFETRTGSIGVRARLVSMKKIHNVKDVSQ
ncbi:hypothetical protein B0H16DRAFT_1839396 [Mycena metata]|uniref:Uncharacterized protein n=1 Tax=Mycena metata TaxID=1033252 RepID=A0AAD7DS87_9AGAR|nr:hypothetical protein B0H16DRAFT_1839396 [Mycena metata]